MAEKTAQEQVVDKFLEGLRGVVQEAIGTRGLPVPEHLGGSVAEVVAGAADETLISELTRRGLYHEASVVTDDAAAGRFEVCADDVKRVVVTRNLDLAGTGAMLLVLTARGFGGAMPRHSDEELAGLFAHCDPAVVLRFVEAHMGRVSAGTMLAELALRGHGDVLPKYTDAEAIARFAWCDENAQHAAVLNAIGRLNMKLRLPATDDEDAAVLACMSTDAVLDNVRKRVLDEATETAVLGFVRENLPMMDDNDLWSAIGDKTVTVRDFFADLGLHDLGVEDEDLWQEIDDKDKVVQDHLGDLDQDTLLQGVEDDTLWAAIQSPEACIRDNMDTGDLKGFLRRLKLDDDVLWGMIDDKTEVVLGNWSAKVRREILGRVGDDTLFEAIESKVSQIDLPLVQEWLESSETGTLHRVRDALTALIPRLGNAEGSRVREWLEVAPVQEVLDTLQCISTLLWQKRLDFAVLAQDTAASVPG